MLTDKTEQIHILMCKQATELQMTKIPLWGFCKFINGDLFVKGSMDNIFIYADNSSENQPKTEGIIWLPTQEQIQQLLLNNSPAKISPTSLLALFAHWCIGSGECMVNSEEPHTSITQMWLMYYMKDTHNKYWNYETNKWELK